MNFSGNCFDEGTLQVDKTLSVSFLSKIKNIAISIIVLFMGNTDSTEQNSRQIQSSSRGGRNVRVRDNVGRDQQVTRPVESNIVTNTQRPIPVQTVSASKKLDVLTHIRKNSVHCIYSKKHPGRMYLQFNFDAKVECLVTLYFFSVEVLSKNYVTQ